MGNFLIVESLLFLQVLIFFVVMFTYWFCTCRIVRPKSLHPYRWRILGMQETWQAFRLGVLVIREGLSKQICSELAVYRFLKCIIRRPNFFNHLCEKIFVVGLCILKTCKKWLYLVMWCAELLLNECESNKNSWVSNWMLEIECGVLCSRPSVLLALVVSFFDVKFLVLSWLVSASWPYIPSGQKHFHALQKVWILSQCRMFQLKLVKYEEKTTDTFFCWR